MKLSEIKINDNPLCDEQSQEPSQEKRLVGGRKSQETDDRHQSSDSNSPSSRKHALRCLLKFLKLGAYLNDKELIVFLSLSERAEYKIALCPIRVSRVPEQIKEYLNTYIDLVRKGDRIRNRTSVFYARKKYFPALAHLNEVVKDHPEVLNWLDRAPDCNFYKTCELKGKMEIPRLIDSTSFFSDSRKHWMKAKCEIQVNFVRRILTRVQDGTTSNQIEDETAIKVALDKLSDRTAQVVLGISELDYGDKANEERDSYPRGLRYYRH